MRIIVVEPHPDDAFLSLGWHLEHVWRDEERLIVTVYADMVRAAEGLAYANAIGAGYECLGLRESGMESGGQVRKVPELVDCLADLRAVGWDRICFPLGLQHPDHLRVSISRPADALRYVDTPYQTKQKLAGVLADKTEGMEIRSMYYPGAAKWRRVPIFKSQAKFFHFNPMKDLRIPEILLGMPESGGRAESRVRGG